MAPEIKSEDTVEIKKTDKSAEKEPAEMPIPTLQQQKQALMAGAGNLLRTKLKKGPGGII